jgi:hypothetical protein
MDLKDVRLEHFAGLVGQTFAVELEGDQTVDLELAEAEPAAGDRPDNAFSLIFRGPVDPCLTQQTYNLRHADLGTLPIFLVPIGRRRDGMSYEAVFTRLEDEEATP